MTRLIDGLLSVVWFFVRGILFAAFLAVVIAVLLGALVGIVAVAANGHPIWAIMLVLLGLGLLVSPLLEGLLD